MKNLIYQRITLVLILMLVAFAAENISAQTTEFTYQGSLKDGPTTANGSYDFEFALFDNGGVQLGAALARNGVAVAGGIFSVQLDFGNQFPGTGRFLEIRVRPAGGGAFTTLTPRQSVSSAPYSVKSLNADNATTAVNATTAATSASFSGALAGDVTGTQTATTVARLQGRNVAASAPVGGQVLKFNAATSQWEPGTDNTGSGGGGGTITGVTAGVGLTGGGTTGNVTLGIADNGVGTPQLADGSVTDAKITNISGSKVSGPVANATTANNALSFGGVAANQYLQINGSGSGLTGLNAASVTTGTLSNARLGQIPTANIADSAVTSAKIAGGQVVKGVTVGATTLTDNVTLAAGSNITIIPAGNTLTIASTSGGNAILNQTAQQASANFNISGSGTAGGTLSGNTVNATAGYTIAGNRVLTAGSGNIFAGFGAGQADTGTNNAFVGQNAGAANTDGIVNTFVGTNAGSSNTHGILNAFFGASAGGNNTLGGTNAFFGFNAGLSNTTEANNSFFGADSDGAAGITYATAIGYRAKVTQSNSLVLGSISGTNGGQDTNVGIGTTAPISRFHIADNGGNILFGNAGCNAGFGAVGFGSTLNCTNYSLLGEGTNTVLNRPTGGAINFRENNSTQVTINAGGTVSINTLGAAGSTQLCRNASNQISTCSSSLRYKKNINQFTSGLNVVNQLRPITFDWKDGGMHDVGFGAEDVAKVNELLVIRNDKGEVEGVKYDRLSTVLVNAVKEQQAQIEAQAERITQQQSMIDGLRKLVCSRRSNAGICKEEK